MDFTLEIDSYENYNSSNIYEVYSGKIPVMFTYLKEDKDNNYIKAIARYVANYANCYAIINLKIKIP